MHKSHLLQIKKLSPEEIEKMGILKWNIWEKEKSVFPWVYTTDESCYFEEGKVKIIDKAGNEYNLEKGDFVVFPQGLECTWEIIEPVRKRYNFS